MASTRKIVRSADVGEVLLFRHSGTKAELLDVAVLDPFEKFVDDYARQWAQHNMRGETVEQRSRLCIVGEPTRYMLHGIAHLR